MITVSSCGVKLQEVLSGLEKERLKHWKYMCTFVAFLNINFFLSACGVTCGVIITIPVSVFMGSLSLQTLANMWLHFRFFF